jgi:hypothetical protein
MDLINESAVAKPETVRSKSFPAIVREGMWVKEMIYFSFPAPFFGSFFGRAKNEQAFWASKRTEQMARITTEYRFSGTSSAKPTDRRELAAGKSAPAEPEDRLRVRQRQMNMSNSLNHKTLQPLNI